MDNSDVVLRIRYAASLNDSETVRIIALGGQELDVATVAAWRDSKKIDENDSTKDDSKKIDCRQADLDALLSGLVIERRGPPPKSNKPVHAPPESKKPSVIRDNNVVLKQLRIAFKLRTDDVHDLIVRGGGRITKSETGALFRNPSARNFRRCGDQVLRWFLKGLGERERGQS